MEQIGNELKKVLKAGIGVVATGVELTQGAIDTMAKKGEPLYQQAKTAVTDAAGKVKKAVDDCGIADVFSCRPRVQSIINDLKELTQPELDEIRAALDEIYPTRPAAPDAPPQNAAPAETPPAPEEAPEDATEE